MTTAPPESAGDQASFTALLRTPGVASILAANTTGKLANGLIPFGLIALFSSQGDYAAGGTAFAIALVVGSFATPFWARRIDRYSAIRILPPLALLRLGLYLTATALANNGFLIAALATIVLAAASSSPSSAVTRAIWTTLTDPGGQRRLLHSVDSILEESLFIATPLITSLIWVTIGPLWAVVVGSFLSAAWPFLIITVGRRHHAIWEVLTRRSSDSATARHASRGTSKVPMILGRRPLAVVSPMAGLGLVMGGAAAVFPAWAALRYEEELSGVLLSAVSAAGVLGGLVYGKWKIQGSLWLHYMIMGLTVGLGCVALALSDQLWVAIPAVALMGIGMTPMFVVAFLLVDRAFPKDRLVEANATVGSSYNLASGSGAVIGGALVATLGPLQSFAAIGLTGMILGGVAILGARSGTEPEQTQAA